MGSWGYGIRHDDFVRDVIGDFEDVLKAGKSVAEATAAATGRSLLAWEEDRRGQAQRRAVLEKFIRKLEVPKAKPARGATTIVRAPMFGPGECLSIHRFNGEYGAAIVLAADHSTPEYGKNLVGVLDYSSDTSPTMEVFLGRQWRRLSHPAADDKLDVGWYFPIGFRKVKERITIVGTVEILDSDPKDGTFYFRWGNIGDQPKRRQDDSANGG